MSGQPAPAPEAVPPAAPAFVGLNEAQSKTMAETLRAQANILDPSGVNGQPNSVISKIPGAGIFGFGGGRRSRRGKRSRKLRSRRR